MYSLQARQSSVPTDEEEVGQQLSSLPPSSPPRSAHSKQKKAPSITPRRFTRFFTPRPSGSSANSSVRVLFDVGSATNARSPAQSSPLKPFSHASGQENVPPSFTRKLKRRKIVHTPTGVASYGNAQKGLSDLSILPSIEKEDPLLSTKDELEDDVPDQCCSNVRYTDDGRIDDSFYLTKPIQLNIPKPIKRFTSRLHGSRLGREIGTGRRQDAEPVPDWQDETASFYTNHADIHETRSITTPGLPCVPFCVEGNRDRSIVAVGDEEGYVRLLETNLTKNPHGNLQSYVGLFRAHTNAIIDVAWSGDGRRIATASGDQTGKITDLEGQQPLIVLAQHTASLKQIRFQPGNDNILATSGRDGSVQIWDLRCQSPQGPVQQIHMPPVMPAPPPIYGCGVGDIFEAHDPSSSLWSGPQRAGQEISVTALQFLPHGRENLLLTASNSNAAVKIWDLRAIRPSTSKGGANTPLSQTAQPILHKRYRDFGVSSMALSGDGSRLFTVNKDSTVYAYSTAHLLLGSAPELDAKTDLSGRPRFVKETKLGLGPLYGYRHPELNVGTFYIKSAIRPARNGKSELLAVGNSNGSAILIPTDERHHSYQPQRAEDEMKRLRPQKLASKGAADGANDFPIYHNATSLVRGHEKEIGAMAWTSEGNLMTVDDAYVVRCWREDAEVARDLRTGGEGEGRRWAAGWAEVCGGYDDQFY